MDTLTTRALNAYYRTAKREGFTPEQVRQPSRDSGPCEIAGKQYVALQNVNGPLAVYRVRNDGALKRLKRWPAGL